MQRNGVLIALAYPEEMVAVSPAWYNWFLERIGMVRDDRICAGHAALILINKETGILEYADFGRYITPQGMGRTRTIHTDPECFFNVKAKFDSNGSVINKDEIIQEVYANPTKTHGAGRLYASFCHDVNYEKAKKYIMNLNLKGSLNYDPFKKNASNCARFVFDTFMQGVVSRSRRFRLFMGNILTASPLGIVYYGTDEGKVYSILNGEIRHLRAQKYGKVLKYLFHKPTEANEYIQKEIDVPDGFQYLDGIGDQAWFRLTRPNGKYLLKKISKSGIRSFEREFEANGSELDLNQPFKLVHDCNALWFTVEQNGKKHKIFNQSYYELSQLNSKAEVISNLA